MGYYLASILSIYLVFLIARHEDRRARRAFAARLGALYRLRGEFWRLRVWAHQAHGRGDGEASARFREQAADLVPEITGQSTALRRDDPALAGELGWTAGLLDDELADMGRALASADLAGFEGWITGRGRRPVDAVLHPPPTIGDDALSRRIHTVFGVVVGAGSGFAAWMGAYWNDPAATATGLLLSVLAGGAVLGYVAGAMRDTLWHALLRGLRHRGWWAGPA